MTQIDVYIKANNIKIIKGKLSRFFESLKKIKLATVTNKRFSFYTNTRQ